MTASLPINISMSNRSIIFAPLDIPKPPVVDRTLVTNWVKNWYDECFYTKTTLYDSRVADGYPWMVGQPFRDPSDNVPLSPRELELRNEFKELFPELTDYLHRAYPLELSGVTILLQQQSKKVVGHTDSDYVWAPRCYLWNDYQEEALWFRVPKDPSKIMKFNTLIADEDYSNFRDPVYAKFPEYQYQPFAFNSIKSIHGVDGCEKQGASRCTVIIRGKIDQEGWYKLLHRSCLKYPDYIIWR
jgi:hypothetical protein